MFGAEIHHLPLIYTLAVLFYGAIYYCFDGGDVPYSLFHYSLFVCAVTGGLLFLVLAQDGWKDARFTEFGGFLLLTLFAVLITVLDGTLDVDTASQLTLWLVIYLIANVFPLLFIALYSAILGRGTVSSTASQTPSAGASNGTEKPQSNPRQKLQQKQIGQRTIKLIEFRPLDD